MVFYIYAVLYSGMTAVILASKPEPVLLLTVSQLLIKST